MATSERCTAFLAWCRCRGQVSYEFDRVYDAGGRLCPRLSFWWATPLDEGERPATRWITYEDYCGVFGAGALSYDAFSSPMVPFDEIERWIAAARRRHSEAALTLTSPLASAYALGA